MHKYEEERDEIIRPRKTQPKERKPKADHKHEYEEISEKFQFWNNIQYKKYLKCKVCGKLK